LQGNRFFTFTLILLTLLLGFLSFQTLRPFLSPIAWAIVLSIIFYPLYAFLLRWLRYRSLASAITLAVALLLILGPVSYVLVMLVAELREAIQSLQRGGLQSLRDLAQQPQVAWLLERLKGLPQFKDANLEAILLEGLSSIQRTLISKITVGAKNILQVVVHFVFMAVATFFLLRDGPAFMANIRGYLPFSEPQKQRLERQVKDMVVSTIFGGVVVALVQGSIGGITFYLLGLKSPVLWGTAIFIMSFVPVVGTFSVWGPAVVYLLLKGLLLKAVVLAVVGTFVIGMVDNVLKPIIISGRTKMHTLLIFFSVLGGLKLFGVIGLIMGPLSLALFLSVLEIFRNIEGGSHAQQG
jgi:predicted PurR-regulated permease PerM